MKSIGWVGLGILLMSSVSSAQIYDFQGYWVDVDAWAGSGSNETILVVDWNGLDHGAETVSPSHAFGFRWEGQATEYDMFTEFQNIGIFTFSVNDYGALYLKNLAYEDPEEITNTHFHIEDGSWNLGSSLDPYARWGTWGDSDWYFNEGGIDEEWLANGQFEGVNAFMYFGTPPEGADLSYQLDIPLVPEPMTVSLLGWGGLFLFRKRNRK